MTKTTVMAGFDIYGDNLVPDVVTRRLGIQPTRSWTKGDRIGKGSEKVRRFSYWGISTGYEESDDVSVQLAKALDPLKDKSRVLNELREEYGLEYRIDIVPRIGEKDPPLISLDHWVIDLAQSIRARVWVDLYVYS